MKKYTLLFVILVASMVLTGCSKFKGEYGHARITINLEGTYRYFVKVNVLVDDKVLDVISADKPTVTVEFPINEKAVLRTEAVCDEEFDLVGICYHKMNATYDIQVMDGKKIIATNNGEYAYPRNYQTTVSDTQISISSVYKLVHQDVDREFTLTKTEIISPKIN